MKPKNLLATKEVYEFHRHFPSQFSNCDAYVDLLYLLERHASSYIMTASILRQKYDILESNTQLTIDKHKLRDYMANAFISKTCQYRASHLVDDRLVRLCLDTYVDI